MKFEKLNQDKIRITLNLTDLEEKNIDIHTFMSNSIQSQQIFLDMLEEAEKQVGFKTDDYRIIIEALALSNGSFVLTITKIDKEIYKEKNKYKKLQTKRKLPDLKSNIAIYKFSSFDEFCDFCQIFSNESTINKKIFCSNCSLYTYKQSFFLVLNNINFSIAFTKIFFNNIIEYALPIYNPNLFYAKLQEYGETIIKSNALNICLKYFRAGF